MKYELDKYTIFTYDHRVSEIWINTNKVVSRENSNFIPILKDVLSLMKISNQLIGFTLDIENDKEVLEIMKPLCLSLIDNIKLMNNDILFSGILPQNNDGLNFIILDEGKVKAFQNYFKTYSIFDEEFYDLFRKFSFNMFKNDFGGFVIIYSHIIDEKCLNIMEDVREKTLKKIKEL